MSMRTKAEQAVSQQEAIQRGVCAEAGPWGAVCTLQRNHDYSDYDGGLDVSFNYHWMTDTDVPLENHPCDCNCGHCTPLVH